MAERELQLELSEDAKDLLVEKGWTPPWAPPAARAIQRYIEDRWPISSAGGAAPAGGTVHGRPAPEGEDPEVTLTVVEAEGSRGRGRPRGGRRGGRGRPRGAQGRGRVPAGRAGRAGLEIPAALRAAVRTCRRATPLGWPSVVRAVLRWRAVAMY